MEIIKNLIEISDDNMLIDHDKNVAQLDLTEYEKSIMDTDDDDK